MHHADRGQRKPLAMPAADIAWEFRTGGAPGALASLRTSARALGFASLEDSVSNALLAALRHEADTQGDRAEDVTDGGDIVYHARLAKLGDTGAAFLGSAAVSVLLDSVLGRSMILSRDSSCYTYYEAGDFLGPHRDNPDDCEVTLILYLEAHSPRPDARDTGLALRVYGEHYDAAAAPRAVIPTRSGTLVVGQGSRVWHERPRLQAGERVVALTACFCPPVSTPRQGRAPRGCRSTTRSGSRRGER